MSSQCDGAWPVAGWLRTVEIWPYVVGFRQERGSPQKTSRTPIGGLDDVRFRVKRELSWNGRERKTWSWLSSGIPAGPGLGSPPEQIVQRTLQFDNTRQRSRADGSLHGPFLIWAGNNLLVNCYILLSECQSAVARGRECNLVIRLKQLQCLHQLLHAKLSSSSWWGTHFPRIHYLTSNYPANEQPKASIRTH
jgi:hypothetical protein